MAASCRDDFVPHEVQPDHLRCLALIEVAVNGIAHALVQLGDRLRLRDDRLPKNASADGDSWLESG
jgi:hypothetical protein